MSGTKPPARDSILVVREALIAQNGKEPSLAAVGAALGISRERVRQIYASMEMQPISVRRAPERLARLEQVSSRRCEKAQQRDEKRSAKSKAVMALSTTMTQTEVASQIGMSQRNVSRIYLESGGERKRTRFSAEEDRAILNAARGDMRQIAVMCGRSKGSCDQRRRFLLKKTLDSKLPAC